MKKAHVFLGVASALFLAGSLAQYLVDYYTAALFGLVIGVFLGIASYRVYKSRQAADEKARKEKDED